MEFEVEIKRGGITFLVSGYCDCEDVLDMIDKVRVYSGHEFVEVDFDSQEFINDFGDDLYEAIEEYKRDLKIQAAEDRMDARREEGWNK